MAITATEIVFRLSGGAANTDPNAALGDAMSTVGGGIITDATVENLFDNVTGAESTAGDTEYRGFYVENIHGSLTWQSPVMWIQTETPSSDTLINLADGDEAVNAALEIIANESTAPTGPTFTHDTTKGSGISLGSIPNGQFNGMWIERIISSTAAAADADAAIIRIEGDTAA